MSRIKRNVRRAGKSIARTPYLIEGLLGDYDGNVEVGDNSSLVYVRVQGVVLVAYDDQTAHEANVPVVVGYDEANPRLLKVQGTLRRAGIDLGPSWSVGKHAERHRWGAVPGGDDVVFIEQRQILPWRVEAASSGVAVIVRGGYAYTSSGWQEVAYLSDMDLSSHIPSSADHAAYVLIYVSAAGGIEAQKGSEVTPIETLRISDIPAPPDGALPLAAVRVYNGQTSVSENLYDGDIIDLRGSQAGTGGGVLNMLNALLGILESEIDLELSRHIAG